METNITTNNTKSQTYRKRIHDLIPGGAHTYSKGDDQFPFHSPAAIEYGKGAYVWDVDGNKYLDCPMGLTSVSLGHAYEPVLEKVKAELDKGVNFQRPSYIEMEMADEFLSLVPCHDMIKFAKNGSVVTTAAVKLARGYTGKKLVAFPQDHPFYSYDDWFIGKSNCDFGIPDETKSLSVTFKSYDIQSLKELFAKHPNDIACVITEPEKPNNENTAAFLIEAIELAHKHGALFIVDEMITGFKTGFPGSITRFGVEPDMATWGKGIANGFSFCALTGKKEVMELGGIRQKGKEKLFLVSTTHGGETHAIAAGLATIKEFKEKNVLTHNLGIGEYFVQQCATVIKNNKLESYIELVPSKWMPIFIFKNNQQQADDGMRTLAMQEMIKRGILFQGSFVPCFSHQKQDVDFFAQALDASLKIYVQALKDGCAKYLIGEPAKAVFRKYL